MRGPDRLRVLMVIHTPWSRSLGAPRVQLELGEELEEMGDEVEKFSYEDAFPGDLSRPARRGRMATLRAYLRTNRSFAARAGAYLKANARRFDVVDANQTDLPFPKQRLGFSGLLVARSVGLIPTYREFERMAARRWPEPPSVRRLAHQALTWPGARRRLRDVERSFRFADLINVANCDELATITRAIRCGAKVVMFPFGLSEARRQAFLRARVGMAERLATRTVAFIGTWNSRKGSKDWPHIIRRVRAHLPAARFLMLGTGHSPDYTLRDLPEQDRGAVDVIPAYDSADLPGLLARVSVGAFPGYLEGFGFAVLEKLAAGLPTVTYDAPGPRDVMSHLAWPGMVPAGDVAAFSEAVVQRLDASLERYAALSEDAVRVASLFSWKRIARDTRETYLQRLDEIRATGGRSWTR